MAAAILKTVKAVVRQEEMRLKWYNVLVGLAGATLIWVIPDEYYHKLSGGCVMSLALFALPLTVMIVSLVAGLIQPGTTSTQLITSPGTFLSLALILTTLATRGEVIQVLLLSCLIVPVSWGCAVLGSRARRKLGG